MVIDDKLLLTGGIPGAVQIRTWVKSWLVVRIGFHSSARLTQYNSPMRQLNFLLALLSATCPAEILKGRVVRIIDGDILAILDSGNIKHRVRLLAIDTPEPGQPFGKRAAQNLAGLANNRAARVDWHKKDRWQQLIGTVWVHSPDTRCQTDNCLNTLDVGMAQLTQGLAWHVERCAKAQTEEKREQHAFAEYEAQAKGIGLLGRPLCRPGSGGSKSLRRRKQYRQTASSLPEIGFSGRDYLSINFT